MLPQNRRHGDGLFHSAPLTASAQVKCGSNWNTLRQTQVNLSIYVNFERLPSTHGAIIEKKVLALTGPVTELPHLFSKI